jgi:hypothetical protein
MRDRSTTTHHSNPTTRGAAATERERCACEQARLPTRSTITRSDCRAPFGAVKPLRFAPTLRAGGLDRSSRAPRGGTCVMAGTH